NSHTSTMKTRGLICIITGASNGFGRALVHRVVHLMKPGSVLLLVAHSGTLLQELKEDLQSVTEEQHPQICCIIADLSTEDGVEEIVMRPLWVTFPGLLVSLALQSGVLYHTAKAAKNMMFSVLAEEEPVVKVLRYSPSIYISVYWSRTCKYHYISMLLLDNGFASGAYLDFFEV
uniref:Uncharacterized protein n=1 Tax=Amphiprion ocellaris TaxID=80972 RepID=A0A3Q1B162_AMPOC